MSDIESAIWQKYKNQNVLVYPLHPGEPANLLGDFLEQTGITYPAVPDQFTKGKFDYAPGVNYPYPRDVVIDANGVVRSIKNSFDIGEMNALIQQLLLEATP